jgi:hypothetical protein
MGSSSLLSLFVLAVSRLSPERSERAALAQIPGEGSMLFVRHTH